MILHNNEKYILNIIKFGPILLVLFFSFSITQVLLNEKYKDFKDEIRVLEKAYLDKNKQRVKEEVQRVYNYIKKEKEQSEDKLISQIKAKVYEAHKIAANIYQQEKNNKKHQFDKEHTFNTIKMTLSTITYNNGRGYIFMDNVDGIKLIQPANKELERKNFLDFEDANGYKFVKKIVETIKKKTEDYDSYYWYKSGDKKNVHKKISFYKYFEPYEAAIGAGEYVDDFNNELKEKVLKNIGDIRYGDNGYIFIYNSKGTTLSSLDKQIIGTNRINIKNSDGIYLVRELVSFSKTNKDGGFYDYAATISPNENLVSTKKISYLMYFEDWDWMIGSGFYLNALHKDIEERKVIAEKSKTEAIKNIIYISIIVTIIFILISTFISRLISNKFMEYKNTIKKQISEKIEKEKLLIQQSKMATMGEMIANIAHQWKQPLSIISASNGIIKFQKEMGIAFDDSKLEDATDAIENSVKNLSTTIDDFRNFFNPNKISEYFNIKTAFDKTFKLINTHLNNYDIKVIEDIDSIEIKSFQNELLQILINILKNAKDELVANKQLDEKLILIDVKKNNKKLNISIKDNAGGIDENIIDKIFSPYFTTKAHKDGTGIGLYMSKQIVHNLKGTIVVKNSEFKYEDITYVGAEFIIEFPITI